MLDICFTLIYLLYVKRDALHLLDAKTMANSEKKLINVRMSETLADELKDVCEQREIGQSQFIRDAIREKIAAIKAAEPQTAEATA